MDDNSRELEELLNQGFRYALALTNNNDQAFDLVQDSYVKILEAKAPLTIRYLIKTIRNKFIDNQRRTKTKLTWLRRRKRPSTIQQPDAVEPILEEILKLLPPKNKEILMLSVVQGYTAKEIGELMNIPRGTVLSILKRTKDKLKIQLAEPKDVL